MVFLSSKQILLKKLNGFKKLPFFDSNDFLLFI